MGLVSVEERRKTAWMSYPNTIRIASREWSAWLRLTGAKPRTPRPSESIRPPESRCMSNISKGFRNEEATQAPRQAHPNKAQAIPRPDAPERIRLRDHSGVAGGSTRGGLPGLQRRGVHGPTWMRGA